MNNKILGEIQASLTRIEAKQDASALHFDQHVAQDELLAHDVRMLSRQRGFFLTGFAAVGVGIGAGMVYVLKRLLGSH
jgi:hypothetical protein